MSKYPYEFKNKGEPLRKNEPDTIPFEDRTCETCGGAKVIWGFNAKPPNENVLNDCPDCQPKPVSFEDRTCDNCSAGEQCVQDGLCQDWHPIIDKPQFDDKGWPIDSTETEFLLYHRSGKDLSVAFRLACADIDRLEAENKRLREALEKYGLHKVGCHRYYEIGSARFGNGVCTCGLEQALKG